MKTALICALLLTPALAACGSADDDSTSQVSDYTPPPLTDNPPMSGSDIDAIDREVRGAEGEGQ